MFFCIWITFPCLAQSRLFAQSPDLLLSSMFYLPPDPHTLILFICVCLQQGIVTDAQECVYVCKCAYVRIESASIYNTVPNRHMYNFKLDMTLYRDMHFLISVILTHQEGKEHDDVERVCKSNWGDLMLRSSTVLQLGNIPTLTSARHYLRHVSFSTNRSQQ
ncbi:hypothetical protein AMELA_G00273570 [Ameiurus melas]|uniref:Secreted protein n=1 Tax=Ameiurus melas TaxID=219545 RepID=A0A7J5ZLU8_AMEME|nr:hypothetical protein AMELA_G00273570 [Ameiurus melas]